MSKEALEKIIKTINSCETIPQRESALRMAKNYFEWQRKEGTILTAMNVFNSM